MSSATNSDSETQAATSQAVKSVKDIAESKQSPATTLTGYGIKDLRVTWFDSGSFNDIKVTGFYEILNENNRWTNVPSTDRATYSLLVVSSWRAGRNLVQIAYRHDNEQKFKRYFRNNRWTAWQRIDNAPLAEQLTQLKTLTYAGL